MNYKRLEKNITDNIIEAIIKLGYEKHSMNFNYTTVSLNHILGVNLSHNEMKNALENFTPNFGNINFREIKDGFCITILEESVEYVHLNNQNTGFITEFINTVRNHGISIEQVFDVFRKYGDITVKQVNNEEFDYLVYFNNGIPDDYYYCITDEGMHITYHRFTKEDYEDFNF